MQFPKNNGWLEMIFGPMFSGKTEELIRRLKIAKIGKQIVQAFKPKRDTRFKPDELNTHGGLEWQAIEVETAQEILDKLSPDTQVVGIDEAQFFPDPDELDRVCEELARRGIRVIVTGLDLDYKADPFEVTMLLVAKSEFPEKFLAVCRKCGNVAARSQRLTDSLERIRVGGKDDYEPRCRHCFVPPQEEE
ncbi:MAG: thymidine kinase [bacterium]